MTHSTHAWAHDHKGFTLIELMIVVVIIGVLAAIAIPKFSSVSDQAKEAEAAPILKQLFTLQERHKQENDGYATAIAELEGGAENFTAKYYAFNVTTSATGSDYVACAAPKPEYQKLRSFRITQDREIVEGAC